MISAKNICKNYGKIKAIRDVSFEVSEGEILGLLGPNGAGKTTSMRILTCFLPPSSGTARVANYDILESPVEVRRAIGYMPENPPLYPEMEVTDFLRFVAQIKEVPAKTIRSRVEETMEKLHISHIRGRVIGHLSRGYRQRVGLAQALVHDPKVLILDEPTLGLDPNQIIEIRELIRALAGAHTIILSSHILTEVQATCTQVAIINQGKIVAADCLKNLTEGQRLLVTLKAEKHDAAKIAGKLSQIQGVHQASKRPHEQGHLSFELFFEIEPEAVAEAVYRQSVENRWVLLEMNRMRTSLEEIFLRMTASDGDEHE